MLARQEADGKTYHSPRLALEFAGNLAANGAPQDLDLAEKVLDGALACQETRKGDPHLGNFLWEREDEAVEDLNAVQFCLFQLIPMMIQHGNRLSDTMQQRVRESIRLGLAEIRSIDVHYRYTNIVLKDITNTCLGGEYLNDLKIADRGYKKFQAWMAFTNRSGCAYEFNSPNYANVALRVLKRLGDLVKHEPIRIGARTMGARLGLSAALHIHPPTGRWAGPFCRAYRPTIFCETPPEKNTLREWIAGGILPGWLSDALDHRPRTMPVIETADSENGVGIATHHSPSFALGVSTQELTSQANRFIAGQSSCFIVHHTADGGTGVIYTRYVLDDRWLGDFRSTPSRANTQILFEEGQFHGVQSGPRAIGLYTPKNLGAWESCRSAKAVVCWHRRQQIDGIWINDRKIQSLPTRVPKSAVVVIASGNLLTAVRPLKCTDLGRNAPVRLVEHEDHLFLEMYNYLGPPKTFWEQAHPGSFYQGKPQCGFYAELAERADYPDGGAFARTVAEGALKDEAEPPITYEAGRERLWAVEYTRAEQILGIEVDLMTWQLKRRWTQNGPLGWPMLESPIARQTRRGDITLGGARLTCGKAAAWLFASPETNRWVAAYHGPNPAPLTLTVPGGRVEIETMGTGMVVWDNGSVSVEAVGLQNTPAITGGQLVEQV